jgi:hypothetical protein
VLEELRRAKLAHQRHLHADHQIPIADQPDLRLDLDNLRTRCNQCHSAKTMRERGPVGGSNICSSPPGTSVAPIRKNSQVFWKIPRALGNGLEGEENSQADRAKEES